MRLGDIADGLLRSVESVQDGVSGLFEPTVRLGVTGLARSGKTVFITSLVANLLDRGRMPQLRAAADGRIRSAYLQPQPDDTVPRFDFEGSLAALTGPEPHWPEPTRAVSELRLSMKVRPSGLLGGVSGVRTVHLDIVDYPGEWLLDLGLMERSYGQWCGDVLARIDGRPSAERFLAAARAADPAARLDEATAQALARTYTEALRGFRAAGYSDCTPGRFLMPGEMEGSPALTFAPLPLSGRPPRGSLGREFERRFEAYKSRVVRPFFRDHFARIDRQVVLVDALGAIHHGPQAVEDLRRAMTDLLGAFRPGRSAWLTALLMGRRVERILFAASKADHIHHSQHGRLTGIMEALVEGARRRADFAGARTAAMSIAALRATTEQTVEHHGRALDMVRGRVLETGREAAFYPGDLPVDPAWLLDPARDGAERWLDADYAAMRFAPAPLTLKPGDGPPHIRLDRAAEFLIGDRL
jgi:predicted YcjX-like family ATPase